MIEHDKIDSRVSFNHVEERSSCYKDEVHRGIVSESDPASDARTNPRRKSQKSKSKLR